MPLNKAQLMSIPGGPGIVGAVTAGTGLSSTPDGVLNVNPTQACTRIIAGAGLTIVPTSGIGEVTLTSTTTGGGSVPSGAKTIFRTATAPSGWTIDTGFNNRTIRLVSSSAGGGGGSTPFTEVYKTQPISGQFTISGVALSSATTSSAVLTTSGSASINSFNVSPATIDGGNIGSHAHGYTDWTQGTITVFAGPNPQGSVGNPVGASFSPAMSSGSHTHSGSASGSFSGSAGSHQHSVSGSFTCTTSFVGNNVDLSIQYVDVLLCTKS
jgi:hypothetical protein